VTVNTTVLFIALSIVEEEEEKFLDADVIHSNFKFSMIGVFQRWLIPPTISRKFVQRF